MTSGVAVLLGATVDIIVASILVSQPHAAITGYPAPVPRPFASAFLPAKALCVARHLPSQQSSSKTVLYLHCWSLHVCGQNPAPIAAELSNNNQGNCCLRRHRGLTVNNMPRRFCSSHEMGRKSTRTWRHPQEACPASPSGCSLAVVSELYGNTEGGAALCRRAVAR